MLAKLIPPNWHEALENYVGLHQWQNVVSGLNAFLKRERAARKHYYPQGRNIFNALYKVDFDKVRVVIIGIDPYPNEADATGVAFSTPIDRDMTKSVAMIYCAIATDLGGKIPLHGNLDHWTQQGVLLLNHVLTFCPNSENKNKHKRKPLKIFTQTILKALSEDKTRHLHFIIWGGKEEDIEAIEEQIDEEHHYILKAPHPVARDPEDFEKFRICRHFSAVNSVLVARGKSPINWFPQSKCCAILSALFY